ncbi:NapC/NirT family cytochrome c [Aliiroseovarius sp. S1339]|uniref:NapC/NirT family cytochrome c n=1 Tax=Aliiroseovarius sp. S1339 TaxID=2936990 RepID=UPI0020BFDF13|nr:NapC/NirT family cytochrome c [Aliiroseovarius sp. S1339]MCK8464707.1 NapC/NirT family cytochrome c [Aliiroseovarius sp. S1339]
MSASNPGFIRRFWRALWSRLGALSLGSLMILGFAVGVFFWGGFHWALEATNTEKFCITCHEMRDNVYAEYQGTVHQNNSSGVRATCPDCHVPKEWGPKMVRKIKASQELYGHFITGVIDTPEKFEDHRLYLAGRVWTAMKKTDSRECRNCHNFEFMDFTQQQTRAGDNHQKALDEGKTCIDCHQGIAHELPEGWMDRYGEIEEEFASRNLLPGADGSKSAPNGSSEIASYLSSEPAH